MLFSIKIEIPPHQQKFGLNYLVKQKYKIPEWLPIEAEIQHGWYADEEFYSSIGKEKTQLVWNKRMFDACEKYKIKNKFIIGCPFIYYKNNNDIKKNNSAKGTVVFPSHSTEGSNVFFNIKLFCSKLDEFPDEFHPITICLYYFDYNNFFIRSQFESYFNVITVGNIYDNKFSERLYNILSSHRFVTSNCVGTYTFYAINLGLSFFITESKFYYELKEQYKNIESKKEDIQNEKYIEIHNLFSKKPSSIITSEQLIFINSELGLDQESNKIIIIIHLYIKGIIRIFKNVLKKIIIIILYYCFFDLI
jgi:hypothetical protein